VEEYVSLSSLTGGTFQPGKADVHSSIPAGNTPSPPAPLPKGEGRQCWYLGDDYSFCERARQCGYKIMADTSIRLWHIGNYAYGWEDAGQDRPRHDSFLFMLADGEKA
jgi:hypothetical protein